MKTRFVVLIFLFFILSPSALAEPIEISGSYKNLFFTSESISTKEGFYGDMQRLRLEMDKKLNDLSFHITLDNELLISDFSNLADFDFIRSKNQDRTTGIDGDKTSVDNEHTFLRHAIYRAYIKYYQPDYQLIIGKQAIDWTKMRFFAPLDIFNPIGPIDLERDQRQAVDALLFNLSSGEMSGMTLVVAPGEQHRQSFAGKIHASVGTYELALVGGYIKEDSIAGFSFDGYLGAAGFRGEITHNHMGNGRTFPRVSAGVDYNLSQKLYVLFEQFFNGGHDDNDFSSFTSSYRVNEQIRSFKKHLSSLWIRYRWMPLVSWDNYIIYDWDGESIVYNPEINYDVTENADLTIGGQFFEGDTGSEYGSFHNTYYLELKWFF